MSDTTGYYDGFTPVEAIQYHGTEVKDQKAIDACIFIGDYHHDVHIEDNTGPDFCAFIVHLETECPSYGAWLLKHEDGTITYDENKPSWVDRWEWCVSQIGVLPSRDQNTYSEEDARIRSGEDSPFGLYKRPVVRISEMSEDVWTGHWIFVA